MTSLRTSYEFHSSSNAELVPSGEAESSADVVAERVKKEGKEEDARRREDGATCQRQLISERTCEPAA